MNYVVKHYIPYEGEHTVFHGSEEAVLAWLKTCGYYADDLEILIEGPDVYEWMKRAKSEGG